MPKNKAAANLRGRQRYAGVSREAPENWRDLTLTFWIEMEDVCEAIPGDPNWCAIARAIVSHYPWVQRPSVGHGAINFMVTDRQGTKWHVDSRMSPRAAAAQQEFDSYDGNDPEIQKALAAKFGKVKIDLSRSLIEPIKFTEHTRQRQNKRRLEVRQGIRVVKPMSEAEKNRRRNARRAA